MGKFDKKVETKPADKPGAPPAKAGFKFAAAFKGFGGATPDGNLPKLNDRDKNDGRYLCTVRQTSSFESFESDGISVKAEVEVVQSDNPQFKPGSKASIIIHGITAPKEYTRAKALGNSKAMLAAAMTSKFAETEDEIVDPCDDSLPWEEEYVPRFYPEDGSIDLDGARFWLQCTASTSKGGNGFKKLSFEAEEPEEGKKG